MIVQRFQKIGVLCLIGVSMTLPAGSAMARTVTTTFATNSGKTFTVAKSVSFDSSTRSATRTQSLTGPAGKTETVSVTSTPDGKGGLTVTRTATGFNGQTQTSSHTIGR